MELAKLNEGGIEIVFCDLTQSEKAMNEANQAVKIAQNTLKELEDLKADPEAIEEAKKELDFRKNSFLNAQKEDEDNRNRFDDLTTAGFVEFIKSDQPQEATAGKRYADRFDLSGGKIVQRWELVIDQREVKEQIDEIKRALSDTDYKVIKSYEATLAGQPLPYDPEALHSEREALRIQIRTLENSLINDL